MKTAINTQTQNEVRDLLDEYVVTPLNTDISGTLSEIKKAIENLEENTKAEITKISPSINGNISNLKLNLDKSFHFEDENDAFENITDDIKEEYDVIIEKLNKIDKTVETINADIKETEKRIHDGIRDTEKAIQTSITNKISSIDTRLNKSEEATKKELKEIKSQISNLMRSVDVKIESVSQAILSNHSETLGELNKTKEIIMNNYNALLERIEKLEQTISTNFTNSDTAITECRTAAISSIDNSKSEIQDQSQKEYKTMFTISLSFGIANFLGIIAMIILYLIK